MKFKTSKTMLPGVRIPVLEISPNQKELEQFASNVVKEVVKFKKGKSKSFHIHFDENTEFIYNRINSKAALRGESVQQFVTKILLLAALDLEDHELSDKWVLDKNARH